MLARCMHEVYWKVSDASECTGCCKVRSVGICKMDTEDLDTVRDNRGNIYR